MGKKGSSHNSNNQRSNAHNPNNPAYSNNQRSNAYNPNNSAYRNNQRSNSLNPNNPTYNPSQHTNSSGGSSYEEEDYYDYKDYIDYIENQEDDEFEDEMILVHHEANQQNNKVTKPIKAPSVKDVEIKATWEYKILSNHGVESLEKQLNEMAKEGWEAVNIAISTSNMVCLLKRRKNSDGN